MNEATTAPRIHAIRLFVAQSGMLTIANLKARYRKTFAGFLWVIMSPLITYTVQCYVFRLVLKIQVANYPLFLLSGLLPWIFITQTLEMGTSTLVQSARMLKSYPVNPLVYLVAQVFDNAINFFSAFFLILAFALITMDLQWSRLILLPVAFAPLFLAVFGLTWLLAALNVFFRDTRFILTLVLNIAFFLTPIFYPAEFVPENYRWLVLFNPLNYLIVPIRNLVCDPNLNAFPPAILNAFLIAAAALSFAGLYWRARRNLVYLYL